MTPLLLILSALAGLCALFAALFLVARRIDKAVEDAGLL